jgi:hypothetical protein
VTNKEAMPGVQLFTTPIEGDKKQMLGMVYEVESEKTIAFTLNLTGSNNVVLVGAAKGVLKATTSCPAQTRTKVGQWGKVNAAGTLLIKVAFGAVTVSGSQGNQVPAQVPGRPRKAGEVVIRKVETELVATVKNKSIKQTGDMKGQAFAHHFSPEHQEAHAKAVEAIKANDELYQRLTT